MHIARLHIIVVDDLVDAADSTVELLSIWGYDAIACYSSAAGIECTRNRRPDAGGLRTRFAVVSQEHFEVSAEVNTEKA